MTFISFAAVLSGCSQADESTLRLQWGRIPDQHSQSSKWLEWSVHCKCPGILWRGIELPLHVVVCLFIEILSNICDERLATAYFGLHVHIEPFQYSVMRTFQNLNLWSLIVEGHVCWGKTLMNVVRRLGDSGLCLLYALLSWIAIASRLSNFMWKRRTHNKEEGKHPFGSRLPAW